MPAVPRSSAARRNRAAIDWCGRLRRGERDGDEETGAVGTGFEAEIAAVIADYRLADRESHPGSLAGLLGGEERIENTGADLRRDARPGVGEGDSGIAIIVVAAQVGDHPQGPAVRSHRIERVDRKVDEYLLKLVGVALSRKRLLAEFGAKANL